MVWNKALPSGSKAGNLIDDDIQDNNDALETALNRRLTLVTGGSQTGELHLAIELEATRDADGDYIAGSCSITTDTVTGEKVLTYYDGTSWHTVLDPFLNNSNDWVNGQIYTPKALSAGASIASDWRDGNVFTVTLDQDSTLADPTLTGLTSKSAVRYYIITQDSTARTLSFGGLFIGDNKTISSVVDSVNVYECVLDAAGNIQTTLLNVPFATDAEAQAGTSAVRALTPANLAANFDDTQDPGYFEVLGTGLLVQWVYKTNCSTGGESAAFAVAFADTNYLLANSVTNATVYRHAGVQIIDAQNIKIWPNTTGLNVSVIAIGLKA